MARLQNEEFGARNFSRKMLRNFPRFFEPLFCGPEKSLKIPAKLPAKFPSQNREVLHGVGADGVGVKFPIFCSKLLLFALVL